ncbi:MAG: CZB domain-containing protein [Campylobacterales bacterium]|nr:CZB domain-containing protein [Campylobacterales bacterium]
MAKIDHIVFKSRAYSSIFEGQVKGEFANHHNCRLGQWYESGKGKERFGSLPSYSGIDKPHSIVHNRVHDNLVFVEGADLVVENKEAIIQNFTQMEVASDELFTLMNNLIYESAKHS